MTRKRFTIPLSNPPSETPEVKAAQAALNTIMRRLIDQQGEWLEKTLAGLIVSGEHVNNVKIEHHPGGEVRVMVRGVEKYRREVKLISSADDTPPPQPLSPSYNTSSE